MIDKKEKRHKEELETGQWLWHSWQGGRDRDQKIRVWILSMTTFIERLFTTVSRKEENK